MLPARDPPSGTIMFTDIEGSTKLARALGDGYADLIGRHNELLRSVWQRHRGYELGTEGDAFLVAFDDADAGVLAAIDAQRSIAGERWPGDKLVRIRIGLHAGYARPVDGQYRALALNQASRVVGCAHGGQTFTTADVAALVSRCTDEVQLVPLGKFRVRDFDEPVLLHAVVATDVPMIDAAPRVRPAEGHNIVPPTTALLGRAGDIAAMVARMRPRTLTTVLGPGGVGKTRFVVELAMRVAPQWADGVWFVELAPVIAADDVPSAVAHAVGASMSPGGDPWRDVLEHLEERSALVVLDNCEHVVDGVARLVHDLLAHAPDVGVVTTSRTPLGVADEHVHRLAPLAVAAADDPGVELFIERAAGRVAPFQRDDVVALCRELDGLPLAIELAAARTTAVGPAEILARLRTTPSVLRTRDVGRPERHQSLTRSLDWSYELLDPAARCAYRRLSSFVAGFDLDAAERVCADDDLAGDEVAELVWALVDASLAQSDVAAGETRYRMLRVVRAHASSLLTDEEAAASVRRLAQLQLEQFGPGRPVDAEWRSGMAVEVENIRHVVDVLGTCPGAGDVATAQTLVMSIGRYHDFNEAFRAGIEEVQRWLALLTAVTPERAALFGLLASLHLRLGDAAAAEDALDAGERIAAAVGLPVWSGSDLDRQRGLLALRRGDADRAIHIARHALTTDRSIKDRALVLNLLGLALSEIGDNAGAANVIRAEIDAEHEAGMESYLAASHGNLAEILLRLGDGVGAAASQLQCLELGRASNRRLMQAYSIIVAAHLAAADDDWQRAAVLQAAADAELDRTESALYGADIARRAGLLAEAQRRLGAVTFDASVTTGRGLGIDAASDIAAAELRRTAAQSHVMLSTDRAGHPVDQR
jgi:predicted ATPase